MHFVHICCLAFCIGTALAVLHNGEAPRYNAEPIGGELQQHNQQQQGQHQQTLPRYHYSEPAATTPPTISATPQHSYPDYRYTAPTTTTARPATTTTTVRSVVAAASDSYIYNAPASAGPVESYNRYAYYPPPYYQQISHTPALAIRSEANAQQQQVPLSSTPSYFVAQSEAVNTGNRRPNFFAPRVSQDKGELPQETQSPLLSEKEQRRQEQDGRLHAEGAYNYARPVNGAEMVVEPLTPYQRAFHEFADYLLWQRAQEKQQEQQQLQLQQHTRIVTQQAQKYKDATLPQATQSYGSSVPPKLNFPAAQNLNHPSFIASTWPNSSPPHVPQQAVDTSIAAQTYPQTSAIPPRNVFPQYAASFMNQAQAPHQNHPASSGALLTSDRYVSNGNTVEYLEKPSNSWELPPYTTTIPTAAVPSNELGISPVKAHANSVIGGQQGAQQNAQQTPQYFHEPAKWFAQTTQRPLSVDVNRPQEPQQVLQQLTGNAQSYAPTIQQQQLQQQRHHLVSHNKFALLSTDQPQTQPPQIPQWPQNVALQAQQQQQPLYSRVVEPLPIAGQAAGAFAQATLSNQQQWQTQPQANQQLYVQSQQQSTQQLIEGTASAASAQGTQLATQPAQPSLSNSNSNTFPHSESTLFRRPHSSYGVPLQHTLVDGYTYQRSVGQ